MVLFVYQWHFSQKKLLTQLSEQGFDEIRVPLGATDFSEKGYENIEAAAGLFHTVTVEPPAWQPHAEKLFEMLPILDGTFNNVV